MWYENRALSVVIVIIIATGLVVAEVPLLVEIEKKYNSSKVK